jgi:hypothetical protein
MPKTKRLRHGRKTSKKQNMYKMRGCSLGKCPLCGKGGSADAPLAYTGHRVASVPDPHLAYTGRRGGARLPVGANLHSSFQAGGSSIGGPGGMNQYQPAAFYPNGTVGNNWTPSVSGWPGVDGISSNRNFLSLNTYPNDPQTQNTLSERTVSNFGLKGGRRHHRTKKRRGGGLNSYVPSDIINPLRLMSNSVQNSVATLQGRTLAPNPLPENSQLVGTPSYNAVAMFRG